MSSVLIAGKEQQIREYQGQRVVTFKDIDRVHPSRSQRAAKQMLANAPQMPPKAKAIKDEIKAHMGDLEELRAGEYKVTWRSVRAVKLDSKALNKAMPDVYSAFTRESITRRFCVV